MSPAVSEPLPSSFSISGILGDSAFLPLLIGISVCSLVHNTLILHLFFKDQPLPKREKCENVRFRNCRQKLCRGGIVVVLVTSSGLFLFAAGSLQISAQPNHSFSGNLKACGQFDSSRKLGGNHRSSSVFTFLDQKHQICFKTESSRNKKVKLFVLF